MATLPLIVKYLIVFVVSMVPIVELEELYQLLKDLA